MARIFLSFFNAITDINNPNAMPCFYESFICELRKKGNNIYYYSNSKLGQDFCKAPREFVKKIKDFNPDLIILFNNCCYDLSRDFDCPIVIWEVDSPTYFSNINNIRRNPNRYIYIAAQTSSVKIIKTLFKASQNHIYYFPFATSVQAEKLPIENNIVFIGTKFNSNNIITDFMYSKPSVSEVGLYKEIINYINKNPFSSEDEIIARFKVKSKRISNNISIKKIVENISAKDRIQILSLVSDLGLAIYGTQNWLTDMQYYPDLALDYQDKLVYSLKQNQDIYNSSKIGININHIQAQAGFSWRVCDIMASNACLVTQPRKDMKLLFPKIKIPTYSNKYEAYEVCKKLLHDENLRKSIVQSCQNSIDEKFRFSNRLKDLEQITGLTLFCNKKLGESLKKMNFQEKQNNNLKLKLKIIMKKIGILNLGIKARLRLIVYALLLIINQIPLINKKFIDINTIIDVIKRTANNQSVCDFSFFNNTKSIAKKTSIPIEYSFIEMIRITLKNKKRLILRLITKLKLILYSLSIILSQIILIIFILLFKIINKILNLIK